MKIKFLVGVVIVALAVAAGIMLLPTKAVQKETAAPVVSENKAQVSVARAAANLSPGEFPFRARHRVDGSCSECCKRRFCSKRIAGFVWRLSP